MAGNKINTKKKEEKSKFNRIAVQNNEDNEEIDFSLLRKPVLTSITGFAQARKIFDQATEELKGLLTNECDLLYECKVCRNIFRSLANFISHKRVYCKESFNSSLHGYFIKETCTIQELSKIKKWEESYQESLNEKSGVNSIKEGENDERIPMTKDLTQVIERVTKTRGLQDKKIADQQLTLHKIPKSSVAVFQNIDTSKSSDNMRSQVIELHDILSQENAVLQSDGTFKVQNNNVTNDNVIQISDDDENENTPTLKCKMCDLQFATLKTLKFHMKYKHLENRLVYPCPDCIDIFSTSWSVYRHLFKVHRKTAAQIRRLRESIQAKAFRMNNPPAFYEKRKTAPKIVTPQKISEEERLDQENQAWLEELDGESEGRRCGGCGRTFERRAALVAHSHTCARRHRRRIQIQIRKDYHKEQTNPYLPLPKPAPPPDSKTNSEDNQPEIKINNTSTKKIVKEKPIEEAEMTIIDDIKENQAVNLKEEEEEDKMESEEIVAQTLSIFYDSALMNKLPFAQQAEKSNLNAFKQKMLPDVDLKQLKCKMCDIKYVVTSEFLDHMAEHYKWVRYSCKLCNFKHFNFDKLPEHVKIVHKLKGDTDFYFSTVKAIEGAEALELVQPNEGSNEVNEISPDSRRPSRCSSDSSRISDDSSSSSTRVEGSRKRKINRYRSSAKKKKETFVTEDGDVKKEDDPLKDIAEHDSSSNSKIFEENSSDFDDVDEKVIKRQNIETSSVASGRPVRKKTKPKNEDFEYDLSNLLKMEAQGYREYTPKYTQAKKKAQQDIQQNYEIINKDCSGALVTISRKSVGKAQAHMKIFGLFNTSKESRISAIFARPMIPRVSRGEKVSPKKEEKESKDLSSPVKIIDSRGSPGPNKNNTISNVLKIESDKEICETSVLPPQKDLNNKPNINTKPETTVNDDKEVMESKLSDTEKKISSETANSKMPLIPESRLSDTEKKPSSETAKSKMPLVPESKLPDTEKKTSSETAKSKMPLVPESKLSDTEKKTSSETAKSKMPLVPITFRRQSLEVIKNPIIKKNITDFAKAGMKTKILLIKPFNRNSDGIPSLNAPVKFQTIKLKDPTKANTTSDDKNDQGVVVKLPSVESTSTVPISNNIVNTTNLPMLTKTKCSVTEKDTVQIDTEKKDTVELDTEKNDTVEIDTEKRNYILGAEVIKEEVINDDNITSENKKCDFSESINDECEALIDSDKTLNLEG